ncbi:hypothetical protein XHV734_0564 [Xanthomonas hortorum pv. vitians]|nr:hypothetical protein XHV734_0564 [Xanthomonas hortorum pv. vitians]
MKPCSWLSRKQRQSARSASVISLRNARAWVRVTVGNGGLIFIAPPYPHPSPAGRGALTTSVLVDLSCQTTGSRWCGA